MRWQFIFLTAFLSFTATQVAHTQRGAPQPTCEVACQVNPFTAPSTCDCEALGGEQSQEPDPPEPVQAEPSCEVACSVNPFTAPAGCDCSLVTQGGGGGGGTGGGGSGPSVSPASIVEDGMVSVDELLDYMEQLYRARIAGVQDYYFLERMVVGQTEQASARPRYEIRLASTAQPAPGQGGLTGINTGAPVLVPLKKVQKDGRPAMKRMTRREQAQQRLKDPEVSSRASADEMRAAEALAADPSLFFGALGQVADILVGAGAGDVFREEEKNVAATFEQDEQESEENAFADDILGELLELKKVQDAELAAGGETEEVNRRLSLGFYERGRLKFHQGPRCASSVHCTLNEIINYVFAQADSGMEGKLFCMVWRPTREAMASFKVASSTEDSSAPVISDSTMAELWLPIGGGVMLAAWESYLASPEGLLMKVDWEEASDAENESFEQLTMALGGGDYDRPIRMKVALANPTNAGFSVQTLDRVYDDFRPVETGADPPMYEPHRIREQIGSQVCGKDVDIADVLDPGTFKATVDGKDTPELKCADNITRAATDRFRRKFEVNKLLPSAAEEARLIADELGCIGSPSTDPNSPCYAP